MSLERPIVESLEGRALLSGSPINTWPTGPIGPISGIVQGSGTVDHSAAGHKARGVKVVASTKLVGDWDGKVTAKLLLFVKKKYSAAIDITSQTKDSITGSITIKGKKYSGTFTGHTDSDGSFVYQLKKGKTSIKIEGKLGSGGDSISGKITAKYDGWTVKGDFKFTKD